VQDESSIEEGDTHKHTHTRCLLFDSHSLINIRKIRLEIRENE